MTLEEKTKILEEINKEIMKKGRLLYSYEIRGVLDQFLKETRGETERPQGECRTCRHRDPEDKKCDCGGLERQGCQFPVSDNYFCKFYEKGSAE